MKKLFSFIAALVMSATLMAEVITIEPAHVKSSYADGTFTAGNVQFSYSGLQYNQKGTPTDYASKQLIQFRKSGSGAGAVWNTSGVAISKIVVYKYDETAFTMKVGNSTTALEEVANPAATETTIVVNHKDGTSTINATAKVYTFDNLGGKQFFKIENGTKVNYIYKIEVYYATVSKNLTSLEISGTPSKTTYYVGDAFEVAGLTVLGKYDDNSQEDVTSQVTWEITPAKFTSASTSASVSVVAKANGISSTAKTINNIIVNEKSVPTGYPTTYTSNVELSTTGGTSASAAKVIYESNEYPAIKAGTGDVAGACVVTVPSGTKTLHFHAVGWNKENVKISINNNTEISLTSDAGISGNSPFTLVGDAYEYYFSINTEGVTSFTLTATSGKRFVIFGVNAELETGIIAAPVFTPSYTYFDESVQVTLSSETEGAAIYYTTEAGATPSATSTLYTTPIKLTNTTSIRAIAIKDGKESEITEKTYTLVPAYTLAEIVALGAPTEAGRKVVIIFNDDVITKIYSKENSGTAGLYFKVGEQEVELYQQNFKFPTTWAANGKISGRVIGDWVLFGDTWELKISMDEIVKLTYKSEGQDTGLDEITNNTQVQKFILDNQIVILKGNHVFTLQGQMIK